MTDTEKLNWLRERIAQDATEADEKAEKSYRGGKDVPVYRHRASALREVLTAYEDEFLDPPPNLDTCPRCKKGEMKPGIAADDQVYTCDAEDMRRKAIDPSYHVQCWEGGSFRQIECLKCEACGFSITKP